MKLCPFCAVDRAMTQVRGHSQCLTCKKIINECCRGETKVLTTEQVEAKDTYRKAEGLPTKFLSWAHVNSLVSDAAQEASKKKAP